MDILTHTLSGLAVGTVMAGFSSGKWKYKSAIILISGFGGAIPDLDAISMWSKFDSTFGHFFGLQETGRVIYSAKHWYSHHSFMHSLLAAMIFTLVIGIIYWLFIRRNSKITLLEALHNKGLLLSGFFLGFIIHLIQDMITPASSWGGVRLFFPSEIYIGGTGHIWWWNNYNLFLIVICVLIINCILLIFFQWKKLKAWKYTTSVFLIGCIFFTQQIFQINHNFNEGKYAECEQKSKEIQKEILGERVYKLMQKLDNSLKIYF